MEYQQIYDLMTREAKRHKIRGPWLEDAITDATTFFYTLFVSRPDITNKHNYIKAASRHQLLKVVESVQSPMYNELNDNIPSYDNDLKSQFSDAIIQLSNYMKKAESIVEELRIIMNKVEQIKNAL